MSSIRKISATVSVANSKALVDTSKGCTTFSSRIFEMMPCPRSAPPGFRAKLTHLPHVDPGVPFSESMLVPQFGNNSNWMQTSVLGEGSGNNLEGFRVGLEAICFFAF